MNRKKSLYSPHSGFTVQELPTALYATRNMIRTVMMQVQCTGVPLTRLMQGSQFGDGIEKLERLRHFLVQIKNLRVGRLRVAPMNCTDEGVLNSPREGTRSEGRATEVVLRIRDLASYL